MDDHRPGGQSLLINRYLVAALIWAGVDVLLVVIALPAFLVIARGSHPASVVYWVSILLPNVVLLVVPGGLTAGAYLFVESRMRRP